MPIALTTPVAVQSLPFRLDFADGIVSLGSCFSDEIGLRLHNAGFCIERNPFGTLYNPASVASALHRLIDNRHITVDDLVQHEGLYHSWHHHGSFSRPTAEECLEACNTAISRAHQALSQAKLLLITFGTAYVFQLPSSMVVANCHKLPPSTFTRRLMTVDEIVQLWHPLLQQLSTFNFQLSTLFTVSPIRHLADGAHGNQLSKSTLLLAIEQLISTSNSQFSTLNSQFSISYFPAYEILLDELRDYRFYASDLTHPSPLAVDIVWERFQQATMSPSVIQQAHNNTKASLRSTHRPLHPQPNLSHL